MDAAEPFVVGTDGWVAGARAIASPNFEARPEGTVPTLVVIHNISLPPGEFGSEAIAALFQNRLDCSAHPYFDAHLRGLRVSSHFLVRRDGALEQFVSCDARAWHAGASNFFGRERCNDFSIGIELEGTDDLPFEAAQYATLAALVTALVARYPIDALAGHADIAPGRKTDPGPAFDWSRLARDTALAHRYFPYRRP
ncbi:1,6-anhydro-N-acetylmuramyl-L-alanine amidase AmpD [Trinickia caryophylli]|uniref:1,6-anhydro-N-acetylmuramyl-L-alanine amidase AmpD n=1 Tax=Trinickia caryophylli TaxID=28094 RepID=A0A1X7C9F4_TRICW|nr:1,6-anhydro-N-acetylmuramyl-L-alanine amidase AmpD [Trinickia caryophylli]PMS09337.1 1,6-anhydro-N-acetylmuramyl-L-alanine amidase AmpD [Trinickia caryophylli]TRX19595.1 1,6-anhydro-N-acetylmuramyl-L-alanine amidase AmpD [Trinickia caryophylli]WQE13092.1 1,6-anhydro-N-acetylmuramyl-L-alanine amidase AmpD [Trinickia caryophylli]SME92517.1 AmpD protein [Trinickia caryophylli]GLU30832.1 N-acetyl-anhydromuranmyl-L-alanine amidase [Trinickia caryophylli]